MTKDLGPIKEPQQPGSFPRVEVGDIVHYKSLGSADGTYAPACRAAIVTEVDDLFDDVVLTVFTPEGFFINQSVSYDENLRPGTFHFRGEACENDE